MFRASRAETMALCAAGLLIVAVILTGCPKRPEVAQAPVASVGPGASSTPTPTTRPPASAPEIRVAPVVPPAITAAPAGRQAAPAEAASPLKDVFFDFDQATVRADQQAALRGDADWLHGHGGARVLIQGHCDERGTEEYNLALGERRAQAAKAYLIAAGISAERIHTISYGKERPFVLGHDESAWKWNRRDHLVVEP